MSMGKEKSARGWEWGWGGDNYLQIRHLWRFQSVEFFVLFCFAFHEVGFQKPFLVYKRIHFYYDLFMSSAENVCDVHLVKTIPRKVGHAFL